jgi:hypothetical protein
MVRWAFHRRARFSVWPDLCTVQFCREKTIIENFMFINGCLYKTIGTTMYKIFKNILDLIKILRVLQQINLNYSLIVTWN